MDSSRNRMPDESTLLDLVEGALDDAQARTVRSSLSPEMLARVEAMRSDRAALAQSCRDVEEIDFVDEVMARVERSMLLEDDPVAPPISFRRSRFADWQRYGAAAVFVVLLGGAAIMVGRSLWFDATDDVLAPENLANHDPGDANGAGDSKSGNDDVRVAQDTDTRLEDRPSPDGSGRGTDDGAESTQLAVNDDGPEGSAIANAPGLDIGLDAVLTGRDLNDALAQLSDVLRAGGGGVIVNATLSGGPPGGVLLANQSTRLTDANARTGNGSKTDERRNGAVNGHAAGGPGQPGISEDLLPVEDQLAYSERGYEYTLVGRPSDILSAIGSLNQHREVHRVRMTQPGGGRLLVDLVAPNIPNETDWAHVLAWWSDPGRHFGRAQAVAASRQDEPIVSIPLRVIPTGNGPRGPRAPGG